MENYQEQMKAWTNEDIERINQKTKGFKIIKAPKYPDDGKHLIVVTENRLPFDINRNLDPFVLNCDDGEPVFQSPNKWVVVATSDYPMMANYNKEFDYLWDAINYAINSTIFCLEQDLRRLAIYQDYVQTTKF